MKKEKKETRVWEGQMPFEKFVVVFETLGYSYIIICNTKKPLAFACLENDFMGTCEMLNEKKIMYGVYPIGEATQKRKSAA